MKSEQEINVRTHDSVATLVRYVRNGDLAKTLNTLRTVPGAPNPFVPQQVRQDQSPTGNKLNDQR